MTLPQAIIVSKPKILPLCLFLPNQFLHWHSLIFIRYQLHYLFKNIHWLLFSGSSTNSLAWHSKPLQFGPKLCCNCMSLLHPLPPQSIHIPESESLCPMFTLNVVPSSLLLHPCILFLFFQSGGPCSPPGSRRQNIAALGDPFRASAFCLPPQVHFPPGSEPQEVSAMSELLLPNTEFSLWLSSTWHSPL